MVGDILSPTHLIFVLVVALLVLGPKRLPEVGRQLGSGLRDFRAAINGEHHEPKDIAQPYEEPVAQPGHAEPPSDTVPEHEFAHASAETSSSGHEFAHETSESADKRTDTLG
jgi:sec-independent protein translocase protein TatA